jgi:hypothetical protein
MNAMNAMAANATKRPSIQRQPQIRDPLSVLVFIHVYSKIEQDESRAINKLIDRVFRTKLC